MTQIEFQGRMAERAREIRPSPIRAIHPLLSLPGMISFGGGYPNPKTFPFRSMDVSFEGGRSLRLDEAALAPSLQYGPSDAEPALGGRLRDWHRLKDGRSLEKENLVVLNGAQEGLFIMAYLFLNPHDAVAVSEPTYPGALSAFRAFTRHLLPIPLDGEGMDTATLEAELSRIAREGGRLPKFIYTIPNGHNPGGVALSLARREHMVALAARYDLLILEDDPYQLVRMEDTPRLPTLQSLDGEGRVIRLDSFSKVFAPGLRIGYASGAEEVMRLFVLFKQASNLHTNTLGQRILAAYLDHVTPEGFLEEIRAKCGLYRTLRDAMVAAARALLPEDVAFHVPGEGLFIWFRLPETMDAARMVSQDGRELKIVLVPGEAFSGRAGCKSCVRASYSVVDPEAIRAGMERFAEMIRRERGRCGA